MKRLLIFLVLVISTLNVSYSQNSSQVLLKNCDVFDGENEKLQKGVDVLIVGNLIKKIGKNLTADDNTTIIQANGKTLIPGLIDAHWHSVYAYAPPEIYFNGDISEVAIYAFNGAEKTLMRGFTTVRDVGGNPYAVKKYTDSGEYPGPRLFISGPPISQTAGHFDFRGKNDVPRNSTDPMTYWE